LGCERRNNGVKGLERRREIRVQEREKKVCRESEEQGEEEHAQC
jgi:hypothetical protein